MIITWDFTWLSGVIPVSALLQFAPHPDRWKHFENIEYTDRQQQLLLGQCFCLMVIWWSID